MIEIGVDYHGQDIVFFVTEIMIELDVDLRRNLAC
jgi:hypothetical protein